MSRRVYELFLLDIFVAIQKIKHVAARFDDAQSLQHDFVSWDSVVREFEIIGEATNVLIKNAILNKESQIVVDFRNLLIHHYFGIDAEEVWNVIDHDLNEFEHLVVGKIKSIDLPLKDELLEDVFETNKHLDFVIMKLKEL